MMAFYIGKIGKKRSKLKVISVKVWRIMDIAHVNRYTQDNSFFTPLRHLTLPSQFYL